MLIITRLVNSFAKIRVFAICAKQNLTYFHNYLKGILGAQSQMAINQTKGQT